MVTKSRGRSSERHCWLSRIGSSGDATGSCVDGGSLTQTPAPYIPPAPEYSDKESVSSNSPETSVDSSANESATDSTE